MPNSNIDQFNETDRLFIEETTFDPPAYTPSGRGSDGTDVVIVPAEVDTGVSLSPKSNEKISEEIIGSLSDLLETEEGVEEFEENIDGLTEEERTANEVKAISETTEEVAEVIENTSVAMADSDGNVKIETESGDTVQVKLDKNEESAVIQTEDGETIIILSSDLDTKEVVDETIGALTKVVEDVAVENGIQPIEDHVQTLIKEISKIRVRVVWEVSVPRHEHIQLLDEIDNDQHRKGHNENV